MEAVVQRNCGRETVRPDRRRRRDREAVEVDRAEIEEAGFALHCPVLRQRELASEA